jgi:hypothetical protein
MTLWLTFIPVWVWLKILREIVTNCKLFSINSIHLHMHLHTLQLLHVTVSRWYILLLGNFYTDSRIIDVIPATPGRVPPYEKINSTSDAWQGAPLCSAGVWTPRERLLTPPLQAAEHLPNSVHSESLQSTGVCWSQRPGMCLIVSDSLYRRITREIFEWHWRVMSA